MRLARVHNLANGCVEIFSQQRVPSLDALPIGMALAIRDVGEDGSDWVSVVKEGNRFHVFLRPRMSTIDAETFALSHVCVAEKKNSMLLGVVNAKAGTVHISLLVYKCLCDARKDMT